MAKDVSAVSNVYNKVDYTDAPMCMCVCDKCIEQFLSKAIDLTSLLPCPKCGNHSMIKTTSQRTIIEVHDVTREELNQILRDREGGDE